MRIFVPMKFFSATAETDAPELAPVTTVVETQEAPVDDKKPEPWYETRIRQLSARAKTLEDERAAAVAAAEAAKAAATTPPAKAPAEKDIEARAAQIAAEKEFNKTCDEIWETGKGEYGDFASKIENFKKLGGLPPALIEAAIETGNPHKILYELGANMDEGARVLSLPPLKMAIAVAKLGDKLGKGKALSQADDPITPIKGRRADTSDAVDPDKMPLDKWMAWREKQVSDRKGQGSR
jgi:hypothetical protein